MIVIENGDLIRGDATSASEVDFTVYGLDNNALKFLANGQLASSIGTLYTSNSTDVVSTIVLVNTGAAHNHVNLYHTPSGGTARRLISKDLQLESGYSLHFDGKSVMVLDTAGGIIYGQNVSDTAYGASWDGETKVAPSKNAVYDAFQSITPPGEVKMWPTDTVPTGYLECNGASIDRVGTYADLFAVLGTLYGTADADHFNLPDYRGVFLRGWDHGHATDPNRATRTVPAATGATITAGDHVGTEQADAFKAHTHTYTTRFYNAYPYGPTAANVWATDTAGDTGSTGGNETRPVNTNIMFIIKY
jgi:Phage Tail Collar Domain.